ncbi:MAG: NAD(P)-dependent oxidoreductase [Candidatus Syntrophosphaera sp.]
MKIAITGANGFLGSSFANFFHKLGHEVVGIIRPGADTSLLEGEIRLSETDYASPEAILSSLDGAEAVIHNAGKTRTRTFNEMIQANVGITRNVLEVANLSGECKRFIYISSQAASRPCEGLAEVTEEEKSTPVDWYGRSKVLAERMIRTECARDWTIIRPASVYGPGEKDFLQIFKAIKSGVNFRIGGGERYFSLIHSGELCEFIKLCLEKDEARNQLFFASDGKAYSQTEFTALAEKLMGESPRNITIPLPLARAVFKGGDLFTRLTGKTTLINTQKGREITRNWICSIDKARNLLGWDPRPDLEGNLKSTLYWYARKGWL